MTYIVTFDLVDHGCDDAMTDEEMLIALANVAQLFPIVLRAIVSV